MNIYGGDSATEISQFYRLKKLIRKNKLRDS